MKYEILEKENLITPAKEAIQDFVGIDHTGILDESELRNLLLKIEITALYNYRYDFIINGLMNLDEQLDRIKKAKTGTIDEVITTLRLSWNIPVSEPFI